MFPTLYSKTSKGKTKMWSIQVEGECITVTHGFVNGKLQTTSTIVVGKNKGKRNETTSSKQAEMDARTKWLVKKKAGYSEDNISCVAQPWAMLALDFNERRHNIQYPAFIQRKFDGTRTLFRDGKFWPREPYVDKANLTVKWEPKNYPHLQIAAASLQCPYPLDGEIFTTAFSFEKMVGLSNKIHLDDDDHSNISKLEYHVYDCVAPDLPFSDRFSILERCFNGLPKMSVYLVETLIVDNESSVYTTMNQFVKEGYEGAMIRNANGNYKCGFRSADLQKCKPFDDAEYEIIGFKEGKGKYIGCVIWRCKTLDGNEFSVNPSGTDAENARLFESASDYIGRFLTVKFQGKTANGIPRFPVGKAIR